MVLRSGVVVGRYGVFMSGLPRTNSPVILAVWGEVPSIITCTFPKCRHSFLRYERNVFPSKESCIRKNLRPSVAIAPYTTSLRCLRCTHDNRLTFRGPVLPSLCRVVDEKRLVQYHSEKTLPLQAQNAPFCAALPPCWVCPNAVPLYRAQNAPFCAALPPADLPSSVLSSWTRCGTLADMPSHLMILLTDVMWHVTFSLPRMSSRSFLGVVLPSVLEMMRRIFFGATLGFPPLPGRSQRASVPPSLKRSTQKETQLRS